MDIGKLFNDAWNIYSKNVVTIILSFIVAALLSAITIGILAIPLFTGVQMLFVKAKRGEAITLNNIFDTLKNFGNMIIAGLIIIAVVIVTCLIPRIFYFLRLPALGMILYIAAIIFLAYLYVTWMFVFLLIQDKGIAPKDALQKSRELVMQNNFWMHLLLLVLAGIVYMIPGIIPIIGMILMLASGPYACGVIACAYADEAK